MDVCGVSWLKEPTHDAVYDTWTLSVTNFTKDKVKEQFKETFTINGNK